MPSKDTKVRQETQRRWEARHPEANRLSRSEISRRARKRDPLGYMLQGVKQRAKRDGIEFALTRDDFPRLPTHCPVLGLELRYGGGDGRQDHSASVDRIKSTLGYVPGNVRVMSWRANSLLKDATLDELERLVCFLRSF